MRSLRAWFTNFVWRLAPFSLVVLVTLGIAAFIGVVLFQPGLIVGLLGDETAGHIGGHFRSVHHRVHDLTFGSLVATSVVGLLAQLRRPLENVAGQLMAPIPWVVLMLTSAITSSWVFAPLPIFAALTILATVLHPTGRGFLTSFRVARVDRVMVTLVVTAAVPLLWIAGTNIAKQRSLTDDHAALGHYAFMAALSLTIIAMCLVASLRPDGWRLAAWAGAAFPALLGLGSLIYPEADSSLGTVWALAAIAWGVGFATAAQLAKIAEERMLTMSGFGS